jgi:Response regulator containing a CheY-like receiver domain and an HTH DNA-binding domain
MAGGYSNKEIAHALGTAEGTIKNHVSSIPIEVRRARSDARGAESAGGKAAVAEVPNLSS